MFHLFLAIFGAVYGSFLTAAIPRVAVGKTLRGRSKCESCQKTLGTLELVPLFSFLFLKGKCRGCRSKIGWPTIFIELTMTAWGFFVHFFFPNDYLTTIFVFLFGGILLAIAITDFKQKEIPWVWLIAGGILAMVRIFVFFYQTGSWPATEIFLSVIIGAGWFAWQYLFSRGRWVGNGDIYLGGMLGLIHASSVLIILNLGISYIVGALYAVSLLLAKKSGLKSQIPFGPFLAIGAAIIMLFWW